MENIIKHLHKALLFLILLTFTGCGFLQDVFALGFWAGIIGVVILVIIIWVIVAKFKK